jgi:glutathione peroxidase
MAVAGGVGLLSAAMIGCERQQPSPSAAQAVSSSAAPSTEPVSSTPSPASDQPTGASPMPRTIHDIIVRRIDGTEQSLGDQAGRVLLIVNVASACGYTRQYEGLEALHRRYADRGFSVLGFPCNDFGAQEPGTHEEILEFCRTRFDVTFPMYEKVVALGDNAHPLFQHLSAQPEPVGGPSRWNFTKYLVDQSGNVVARYDSKVEPDDPELVGAIERLLGAPVSR